MVQLSTFRSGVAARLAGIPAQTLRVWERRYQLSGPKPAGTRQRLYGHKDVERFSLIKRLVDQGQSIGSLASLDLDSLLALQDSLSDLAGRHSKASDSTGPSVLALSGPLLGALPLLDGLEGEATLEVRGNSIAELRRSHSPEGNPIDTLLSEHPTLLEESVSEILAFVRDYRIRKAVIFYRYAPSTIIRRLRAGGASVMKLPADEASLIETCQRAVRQPALPEPTTSALSGQRKSPGPQQFSNAALVALSKVETSVFCECPRQLAQLLLSVNAFESYSAQCANRDSNDAFIHARLHTQASKARLLLEESLSELLDYEEIDLANLQSSIEETSAET